MRRAAAALLLRRASALRAPCGWPAVAALSAARCAAAHGAVHARALHATCSAAAAAPSGAAGEVLNEAAFHKVADESLESLYSAIEEYVEKLALEGSDVNLSQGVLTVALGGQRGTFVLNKQTPNRQLWLSSPVSGPWRYDRAPDGAGWRYRRDGHALHARLEEELGALCGPPPLALPAAE